MVIRCSYRLQVLVRWRQASFAPTPHAPAHPRLLVIAAFSSTTTSSHGPAPTMYNQSAKLASNHDRNFITAMRAMQEYLLKPDHLEGLRVTTRRSPSGAECQMSVYWRKDVLAKAIEVWGSTKAIEDEHRRRDQQRRNRHDYKGLLKTYFQPPTRIARENWPVRPMRPGLRLDEQGHASAKVVHAAIAINSVNCVIKGLAWIFTGSHSMFSETVHSAADTCNQIILAYGIKKSQKKANEAHPYGYSNMQYVSSLISGVGIFCMGAGLSIYHGVIGLVHPHQLESLTMAICVLGGSFLSESITLALAIHSIRKSAANEQMGFFQYVLGGFDPCVNVVLLEDSAAVLGVLVAAGSMALSVQLQSSIPDALGSIAIGTLLGGVASFMIHSNSGALIGRSIPEEKIRAINAQLEGDIMIRQILDVKGIDMGNGIVRYKAEVDVDGRELARYYLSKKNLDVLLDEVEKISSKEDLEKFLLQHGENIVDCLGEQVDRIERELKDLHPEIKFVDLEVL